MYKILLLACIVIGFDITGFGQAPNYPSAPTPVGIISKAEYFFDTDPGFNNGTDIPLTPSININNLTATIALNGSALIDGPHRLYIRTMDVNGNWSHTASAQFTKLTIPAYPLPPTSIPAITAAEYFIDTDPGLGMGTAFTLPSSTNISNFSVLVDVTSLNQGAHRLYIRTRDANGNWSLTHYAVFDNTALPPYPAAPSSAPNLMNAEYFIDTDPGFGNGLPIAIPATTDLTNFSVSIPIGSLSEGRHTLYIRSQQNPWSMTAYAEFSVATSLPLTWLYVKGEVLSSKSYLTWATEEEDKTSHFIIEYSSDGNKFNSIGRVAAAGMSPTARSYSFTHAINVNGFYYYRIKQVDTDGKYTYSKVITLKHGVDDMEVYVTPNPVTNIMYIVDPGNRSVVGVEIYDMAGRTVLTERFNSERQTVYSINTNRLLAGSYLVKVFYSNSQKTFTILKK